MVSKFGYKGIGFYVNSSLDAGTQYSNFGEELIRPALFEGLTDYVYEFGEIVEIVGDTKTNYLVKPIDATTTPDGNFGVIMKEVTGGTKIREGRVTNGVSNVALNLWDLQLNTAKIVVSLQGTEEVTLGGAVYLGNGTNGTKAGAIYPEAIENGTIEIEGLSIQSGTMKPSTTAIRTVAIGKGL